MKIEEAILYVLAERNCGMRTEQIAEVIKKSRASFGYLSFIPSEKAAPTLSPSRIYPL